MGNRIGIYGMGRLGHTLARSMWARNLPLAGIASYHPRTVSDLPPMLWSLWCGNLSNLIARTDTIFVVIRDDCLTEVAQGLADARADWTGYQFIHCSGVHGRSVLGPLEAKGAETAVAHPLNSFSDPTTGVTTLPGTWFGVNTAAPDLKVELSRWIQALGCSVVELTEEIQPLYHLVAVLVGNAPLVLAEMGYQLLQTAGPSHTIPWTAYQPLIRTVLEKASEMPPIKNLTGPWVRGDQGTMEAHRKVLREGPACWTKVYDALWDLVRDVTERSAGKET